MLQLTYSNRLEVLLAPLAAHVARAQAEDPLRPVTILIPDRAVAQFIRLSLAEQHGVAANLDFQFLQSWLTDRIQAADAGLRVLDRAALTSLLHVRLLRPQLLEAPELTPIRRWLTAAAGPVERARRPLQLARRVAHLFEEYSYHRRSLIAGWARGPQLGDTQWAPAERWQRALWRALFDGQGVARITPGAPSLTGEGQLDLFGSGPRHLLLPDALRALPPDQLDLPAEIHLFGLSYVAPAFTEIFARLAQASTLWIYTLNPCMEFWEDLDASDLKGVVRDSFARRSEAVDLESGEDPFGLLAPGDTPALRLWARPSREYIRQLNQLTDCRYAPGFVDPTADGATLLTRLQRDILIRHPERAPRPDDPAAPQDDSIRFLACPSARREVEIVADAIWALIARADAAGERLRFHQIAVLVADAGREAYLTHIEAVFRERHDLPFNLVDRRLSARSRILEAIDRLLDLPFGQFEPPDLLPLLTHPALVGGMPDLDLDRWRTWVRALNVRFGADADDLSDTFIDLDVHNWDQALRRLALGACMTGPLAGDLRTFTTPDGGQWIPHDAGGEALVDASRLITLARALIADARAVRDRELSLADWCAWLRILLTRYLTAVEPADEVALARCLTTFERLAESDLEGEPIPYPALRDLARERLAALDAGRGQHQADGVVVSSLLPMRAIPFQAVFILGLGANEFPAGGHLDPLDLRQARRRAGDVRPAERDRHLFLEILLATRRHLTLSWVARDDTTGEPREPSAVIRELQYTLRGFLGPQALDALTTLHPTSPADPSRFPELFGGEALAEDAPLSPSPEARRAAQAKALRARLRHQTAGDLPAGPDLLAALAPAVTRKLRDLLHLPPPPTRGARADGPLHLPLNALQRFLESPLQGAARYTLGLEETESLDVEIDEPVDPDRGQRFSLLRDAFWQGAGDLERTRDCYEALRTRARLAGALPLGIFGERSRDEDHQILAAWRDNLAQFGLSDLSGWRSLRIGRAQEHGPVDALLPAIELSVPTPTGEPLAVHLHGPLLRLAPNGYFAARNLSSAAAADKHFLPGFITLVALAALDQLPGGRFGVIANPTRPSEPGQITRSYRPVPTPDQARAWLSAVVTDLLFEPHDYRFPIEVALSWQRDVEQRGPGTRVFIHPRNDNASRFGPVRDPERFPAPDPARAAAIIERRLRPFLSSARPGRGGTP